MKDQAADVLPEAARVGRLAVSACAYACPGCPVSRDEEALRVRLIGWAPGIAERLGHAPRRDWELASGQPPRDAAEWDRLKRAGVARVFSPFFCGSFGPGLEDPALLMAAHDRESGCEGSAAAALEALASAKASGVSATLIAVRGRSGDEARPEELRVLTRLAWRQNVAVEVSAGGSPPCIAPFRDYNQGHP